MVYRKMQFYISCNLKYKIIVKQSFLVYVKFITEVSTAIHTIITFLQLKLNEINTVNYFHQKEKHRAK